MKIFSKVSVSALSLLILLTACNSGPNFTNLNNQVQQNDMQEFSTFAAQATMQIQAEQDIDGDSLISQQEASLNNQEMALIDQDRDGSISSNELTNALQREYASALNFAQTVSYDNTRGADIHHGPIPTKPPTSTFKNNKVQLYIDKEEILPMIFETLKSAKKSIQLDVFLLGGGIGLKIAYELVEKIKQGVDVKITFDPKLGFAGPTREEVMEVVNYFIKNEVEFKLYPLYLMPLVKNSLLANKFQIDHNKMINVDGNVFITGGFNLFDVGVENRDLMLKIEGGTAQDASELMFYEWSLGENFVPPPPKKNKVNPEPQQPDNSFVTQSEGPGNSMVRIVKTGPYEKSVKPAVINAVRNAKRSVYLSVLEFSDKELIRALVDAHRRGVDVRIIMDRKDTNDKYAGGIPVPINMPNILPAREFVKNRVPVKWYNAREKGQELHMKMCVVDGNRLITGSTNFTLQAFTTFRETSIEVVGGTLTEKMVRTFMEDWLNHSSPIKSLSVKDKMKAKVVEYMDSKYISWW